jgi:thioredoxin reductase
VIIGGGAAGLSAALVLSRARRSVVVVDGAEPRNAPAAHMHGFLSRDGLPPTELLAVGRGEVVGYGGEIRSGVAASVSADGSGFVVKLGDGDVLLARRLLVATGLRDELPDVPGVKERWGTDVLHCPYCHGYEVRGRRLGVLGGGPNALHQVQLVRQWAADVVFFPNGTEVDDEQREHLDARAIGIAEGKVARVVAADDRLEGVELESGYVVARDALFVGPRFVPNADLLADLGAAVDEQGWVVVDGTGRTSVPGVWVAGNAVNPRAQVITAAGEGSAAAIALNADLVEEDVAQAVAAFRAGEQS